MAIKHVLVCVDGSSGDSAALGYSLQIARQLSVHIDVLHVRLDLSKPPKRGGWYSREIDRLFGIAEVIERRANEAAAQAKQGHEIGIENGERQCRDRRHDGDVDPELDDVEAACRTEQGCSQYNHEHEPTGRRLAL